MVKEEVEAAPEPEVPPEAAVEGEAGAVMHWEPPGETTSSEEEGETEGKIPGLNT